MKFLIAGAGAIGAYIGAKNGARGPGRHAICARTHLRTMQERGVLVQSVDGDFQARPKVVGTLEEVGPVDVVFLAPPPRSFGFHL